MTLPNLLIIGAQKCGTTWLHHALNKSNHFWGTDPKELSFWNNRCIDIETYKQHFLAANENAKFKFESTPHYFRLPRSGIDVAQRIREHLGDIPLILTLRNPVDRYLSAYTHNVMRQRVPNAVLLTEVCYDYNMIELGHYHSILKHYDEFFSNIHVHLHDDITSSPLGVVRKIFEQLDLSCDLTETELNFRRNDKNKKQKRIGLEYVPELSDELKAELRSIYQSDIEHLQDRIGRDLGHWLND